MDIFVNPESPIASRYGEAFLDQHGRVKFRSANVRDKTSSPFASASGSTLSSQATSSSSKSVQRKDLLLSNNENSHTLSTLRPRAQGSQVTPEKSPLRQRRSAIPVPQFNQPEVRRAVIDYSPPVNIPKGQHPGTFPRSLIPLPKSPTRSVTSRSPRSPRGQLSLLFNHNKRLDTSNTATPPSPTSTKPRAPILLTQIRANERHRKERALKMATPDSINSSSDATPLSSTLNTSGHNQTSTVSGEGSSSTNTAQGINAPITFTQPSNIDFDVDGFATAPPSPIPSDSTTSQVFQHPVERWDPEDLVDAGDIDPVTPDAAGPVDSYLSTTPRATSFASTVSDWINTTPPSQVKSDRRRPSLTISIEGLHHLERDGAEDANPPNSGVDADLERDAETRANGDLNKVSRALLSESCRDEATPPSTRPESPNGSNDGDGNELSSPTQQVAISCSSLITPEDGRNGYTDADHDTVDTPVPAQVVDKRVRWDPALGEFDESNVRRPRSSSAVVGSTGRVPAAVSSRHSLPFHETQSFGNLCGLWQDKFAKLSTCPKPASEVLVRPDLTLNSPRSGLPTDSTGSKLSPIAPAFTPDLPHKAAEQTHSAAMDEKATPSADDGDGNNSGPSALKRSNAQRKASKSLSSPSSSVDTAMIGKEATIKLMEQMSIQGASHGKITDILNAVLMPVVTSQTIDKTISQTSGETAHAVDSLGNICSHARTAYANRVYWEGDLQIDETKSFEWEKLAGKMEQEQNSHAHGLFSGVLERASAVFPVHTEIKDTMPITFPIKINQLNETDPLIDLTTPMPLAKGNSKKGKGKQKASSTAVSKVTVTDASKFQASGNPSVSTSESCAVKKGDSPVSPMRADAEEFYPTGGLPLLRLPFDTQPYIHEGPLKSQAQIRREAFANSRITQYKTAYFDHPKRQPIHNLMGRPTQRHPVLGSDLSYFEQGLMDPDKDNECSWRKVYNVSVQADTCPSSCNHEVPHELHPGPHMRDPNSVRPLTPGSYGPFKPLGDPNEYMMHVTRTGSYCTVNGALVPIPVEALHRKLDQFSETVPSSINMNSRLMGQPYKTQYPCWEPGLNLPINISLHNNPFKYQGGGFVEHMPHHASILPEQMLITLSEKNAIFNQREKILQDPRWEESIPYGVAARALHYQNKWGLDHVPIEQFTKPNGPKTAGFKILPGLRGGGEAHIKGYLPSQDGFWNMSATYLEDGFYQKDRPFVVLKDGRLETVFPPGHPIKRIKNGKNAVSLYGGPGTGGNEQTWIQQSSYCCWNCGSDEHGLDDCPVQRLNRRTHGVNFVHCMACQQVGHILVNCPYPPQFLPRRPIPVTLDLYIHTMHWKQTLLSWGAQFGHLEIESLPKMQKHLMQPSNGCARHVFGLLGPCPGCDSSHHQTMIKNWVRFILPQIEEDFFENQPDLLAAMGETFDIDDKLCNWYVDRRFCPVSWQLYHPKAPSSVIMIYNPLGSVAVDALYRVLLRAQGWQIKTPIPIPEEHIWKRVEDPQGKLVCMQSTLPSYEVASAALLDMPKSWVESSGDHLFDDEKGYVPPESY